VRASLVTRFFDFHKSRWASPICSFRSKQTFFRESDAAIEEAVLAGSYRRGTRRPPPRAFWSLLGRILLKSKVQSRGTRVVHSRAPSKSKG
jgi:hypothetical protein